MTMPDRGGVTPSRAINGLAMANRPFPATAACGVQREVANLGD